LDTGIEGWKYGERRLSSY